MSSENPRRPPHQSRRPARLHEIEFFPFPEDRATSREAAAALFADLAFAARLDMVIDNARGWFIEQQPDFNQPLRPNTARQKMGVGDGGGP